MLPAMLRNAMASLALGAVLLGAAGCGDIFRPPVSSISPVGPASQPTHYALTISDPGGGLPGIFTMTDFSGDTVLNTTAIGVAPQYLELGLGGTEANILNHDGSVERLQHLSRIARQPGDDEHALCGRRGEQRLYNRSRCLFHRAVYGLHDAWLRTLHRRGGGSSALCKAGAAGAGEPGVYRGSPDLHAHLRSQPGRE